MRRALAEGGDLDLGEGRPLDGFGGGERRPAEGGSSYSNFCGEKPAEATGVDGRLPVGLDGTRMGGGGGLARYPALGAEMSIDS